MSTSTNKEINILLIGEKGCGKSTCVNAFGNYIAWKTFENAENHLPLCLIPTTFTITDQHDQRHLVKIGETNNGNQTSETQRIIESVIHYDGYTVKLIETPGITDIPGIDYGKVYFGKLLELIAQFEYLHAICIILKPDIAKFTSAFEICLKQLLWHLPKSSSNVEFVFTNIQSTNYKPVNTMVLLKKIIDEVNEERTVDFVLNNNTIYCLENESFEFFGALSNGINFSYKRKAEIAMSWNHSSQEFFRLMNHIIEGAQFLYTVNSNIPTPLPRQTHKNTHERKDFSEIPSKSPNHEIRSQIREDSYKNYMFAEHEMGFGSHSRLKNIKDNKYYDRKMNESLQSQAGNNATEYSEDSEGEFEEAQDPIDLNKEKKDKPINILLLGETGVGKSTFINAFVNYLTYETLEEAENEQDGLKCLIPTSFMVTDENYEERLVKIGEDDNEGKVFEQSGTQRCKGYVFKFGNHSVRLIDTPGVGDTRGLDQDKLNFDNVLSFISQYESLHAICILLKPNNSKINVSFEFCIKQLLCHLQKSASNNIVFLFTNARGTFYKPGDTMGPLRKILNQIKSKTQVEIPFNKETIYCLDNEAFRFLVALSNKIKFSPKEKSDFATSWEQSVIECQRLMNYIIEGLGRNPHKVMDTVSINQARRTIITLSQPLADIAQNIEDNLKVLDEHKNKIILNANDIDGLKNNLYLPVLDLKIIKLDYPKTVCADKKCCKTYKVGGIDKFHFSQICHSHCNLENVVKEALGDPQLINCWAMKRPEGICHQCKYNCSYKIHMHIYYDSEVIEEKVVDDRVKEQITTKERAKQKAEIMVEELEERCKKLKQEKKVITKTLAKFAHFLQHNAIATYNDAFKKYLEYLIEKEEMLSAEGSENKEIIKGLNHMLRSYEEEKNILDNALKLNPSNSSSNEFSVVSIFEIFKIINELYELEIFGKKIKDALLAQENARKNEHFEHREVVHKVPKRRWKWIPIRVATFFS